MKRFVFVFVCLVEVFFFSWKPSQAQDTQGETQSAPVVVADAKPESLPTDITLTHRPPTPEAAIVEVPSSSALHPTHLLGGESLPRGMVWAPAGNEWSAREINSCQWCSKPMTFRQAALDKKALGMWSVALAMTIMDVEVLASRPCLASGNCREGNPLLGQTRASQYGIRLPVLAMSWLGSAWLRKGDERRNIGGMKRWWILPALFQAASTSGVIANLAR